MKRFTSCLYKRYTCTLCEYAINSFPYFKNFIQLPCIQINPMFIARRYVSTSKNVEPKSEIVAYQNNLFDNELKRQKEAVGRIEKIVVKYNGVPENVILSMNKGISTPYDCARRIQAIFT